MSAAEIAGTLRALQSGDTATLKAAEETFNAARKQQPAQTVAALFEAASEQQLEEPVREQAAVLLRQCLGKIREEGSTWSQLGAPAQTECKARLLGLMEAEANSRVRKKVADIVQSLGNQLIDIEPDQRPTNSQEWPELMPTLMRVVVDSARADVLRAHALWAVKELMTSVWQVMVANTQQTLQVLKSCLAAPSAAVRANAATLLCELIDCLESKEDRAPFACLAEDYCSVLRSAAESADNEHVNSLLQALQSADFLKDCIGSHILPLLSTIAKSHEAEETQRLALEALITLAEDKPKTMAKVPGYIEQTLGLCAQFMMQLDDDLGAWSKEDDDEAEDPESFTHAKEVVDRLSNCMSASERLSQLMAAIKPASAALFQAAGWKHTVAGITMLAQVAEYVDEEGLVLEMVGAVRAQFRSTNPRVRHAAWTALAQFAEDHPEVVAGDTLAAQLLQEFLAAFDDPYERVQCRAMEAFQLYGSQVEREVLEPFVQPMMEKLGQKLQSPSVIVQKKTITFIAVLAGQMEDGFAAYYGPLMPIFKQLAQSLLHRTEERTVLGKVFECISLLAAAVGTEGFRADAEGIMQAMIQATQVPNLPSNDPVKEYMLEASQRICATMKGDFLPFVPQILPGVLEKLTLAPQEYSPAVAERFGDDAAVNLTLAQEGGQVKVLVMCTSEMEDLQNALGCVHTFVQELGDVYLPYVAQTAEALLPVFDFSMDEEIRDTAFETWGQLCQVARTGGRPEIVTQLVHEFLKRILPKFALTADAADVDARALRTRADGVKACLQKAGPGVLSAEQVKHVCEVALQTLGDSLKRREAEEAQKRQKLAAKEEEDASEAGEEEEEDEEMLRVACCEMTGALMQHHGGIFMTECFAVCMQLVQQFIPPTVRWEDRRLAIFLACDMLEHLRESVVPHWQHFMPQLVQDVVHQSPAIRQPACYGVALAAREAAFVALAAEAAAALSELVTRTRGTAKKKSEKPAQACADNALSALGEILSSHSHAVKAGEVQLWGVWLKGLPCQEDEAEGIKNHKALLRMVQKEQVEVVGAGGANLPHILSVFVDIYNTDMADEETSKGIGRLVAALGQERLQQLALQLKEKQQKKLLRIHREAQADA